MKSFPSPLTLGVEIEVNIPPLASAIKRIQDAVGKADLSTSGGRYYGGEASPWGLHTRKWEKDIPEEFRMPDGWAWNFDAGVEHKFSGPAVTLDDAFNRLDRLGQYFKDWGVDSFSGAGTHVHIGVPGAMNKIKTGSGTASSPSLHHAWSYFALRERGLFALIPSHRRIACGGGAPQFHTDHNNNFAIDATEPGRPSGYGSNLISPATPLRAIHNAMTQDFPRTLPGGHSWMPIYRKSIPTFEIRQFAGTANTDAVKGYMMLLLSMWERARQKIEQHGLDELGKPVSSGSNNVPDFVVHPLQYGLPELKKEVTEAGFFVDELQRWIEATVRNDGEPTAFKCDLSKYEAPDAQRPVLDDKNYFDYEAKRFEEASQSATALAGSL